MAKIYTQRDRCTGTIFVTCALLIRIDLDYPVNRQLAITDGLSWSKNRNEKKTSKLNSLSRSRKSHLLGQVKISYATLVVVGEEQQVFQPLHSPGPLV